ncbi:MAG: M56 family metallopeptidase [Lachnospiraceae bacterium]|nr:M56 family metallopeptidase [Lachnospiraceae bacterium]
MTAIIVGRLWRMSLRASVLILIILAARPFLKRYPKIYSYSLWLLAGISLLCPVMPRSAFSLQPELPDSAVFAEGSRDSDGTLRKIPGNTQNPGRNPALLSENAGAAGTAAKAGNGKNSDGLDSEQSVFFEPADDALGDEWWDRAFPLLCTVYLAGVGIVSVCCLGQYLQLRRRIAPAVRDGGNVWLCETVQSPFVIGLRKPRILMPYTLREPEKSYILQHERTHIRHHDPLARLAGLACICLHWWNPLVWLASRCMEQDMEMFCDESVLKHADFEERKAYAKTLLSCARQQSGLAVGLAFGESNTERRVENIMKKRKNSWIVAACVVVLAIFCTVAFMTLPGTAEAEDMQNSGEAPVYFGDFAVEKGIIYAISSYDEPNIVSLPVDEASANFLAVYNGELYYAAEYVGAETGEVEAGRLTVYASGLDGAGRRRILELPEVYAVGDMMIQDGYLYCNYLKTMDDAAETVVRVSIGGGEPDEYVLPAEDGYSSVLGFGTNRIYYRSMALGGEQVFYVYDTETGSVKELYRSSGWLWASAVRKDRLLLFLEEGEKCRLLAVGDGTDAVEWGSCEPDNCSLLSGKETYCTVGDALYRLDEKQGKLVLVENVLPDRIRGSHIDLLREEGDVLYLIVWGENAEEPENMLNTFLVEYNTVTGESTLLHEYYTP